MKRFLIIALCLAGLAGMAAAQPNPWDPNYYDGTFHGHGDFVPKGNGVWDLGDPGNHWRKAYVDSLLGSALIGYADSSHRADSLKYGAGYFTGTSFLRSDTTDSFTILDGLRLTVDTILGRYGWKIYNFSTGWGMTGTDLFFGTNAGLSATGLTDAIYIGRNAGELALGTNGSTFIGQSAGRMADNADNSIFLGVNTGEDSDSSNTSFMVISNAGSASKRCNNSIFIGGYAGAYSVGDSFGICLGRYSGYGATGHHIVSFGDSSGVSEDNSHVFIFGRKANATADSQFYVGGDIIRALLPKTTFTDSLLLTATKPIQWAGGAYLKDTLGTRLRSISVSFDSTWTDNVLPRTANTGQVGTAANAFNSMYADSFYTNPNIGGVNSWCGIKSSSTSAGSGLFGSDSISGESRVTGYIYLAKYASAYLGSGIQDAWSFNRPISSSGSIYSGGEIAGTTTMRIGSIVATVYKNNEIRMRCVDNPYIAWSDSGAGVARTRDSLVYNGTSFAFTKPVASDTAKHLVILPPVGAENTGSLGMLGNAWNIGYMDTVNTGRLIAQSAGKINMGDTLAWDAITKIYPSGNARWIGTSLYVLSIGNSSSDAGVTITSSFNKSASFSSNGRLSIYTSTDSLMSIFSTSNANKNLVALACSSNYDTTNNGWLVTKNAIRGKKNGSFVSSDTLSGYNGNTWAVNSWGITITGTDTLGKFYMASFDSLKMVRCWASAKSASSGGDPDTLMFVDSLKQDSIKVPWAVGSLWLAPTVLNKKWPTNPGGVLNPVYCIFRKGATTAAANLQIWTTYGLSKGRMF